MLGVMFKNFGLPVNAALASSPMTAPPTACVTLTSTATKSASSTSTQTLSATPSRSSTPSTTPSLGMVLITTLQEAPALQFALSLSAPAPAAPDFPAPFNSSGAANSNTSSSSNATRRTLATTTATAINWNTGAAALALRQAMLTQLLAPAAQGRAAIPPVIDQVLVASVYTYTYATRMGALELFNDTSPCNTVGNTYASTDALVDAMGSAFSSASTVSAATSSVTLVGNGTSLSAAARRLGGRGPGEGSAAVNAALRRLALDLQPGAQPASIPPGTGTVQFLTFNLIAGSGSAAQSMKASLTTAGEGLTAITSAVAAAVSNATGLALTASVDASSVKLISIVFRRSFWGVFLQWLLDNIIAVLAGSCALICFTLLLACFNRVKSYRQQRRQASKAARLLAALQGIHGLNRRSKWVRVRAALLRHLKQRIRAMVADAQSSAGGLGKRVDPFKVLAPAAAAAAAAISAPHSTIAARVSPIAHRPKLRLPSSPAGAAPAPAPAPAATAAARAEAAEKSRRALEKAGGSGADSALARATGAAVLGLGGAIRVARIVSQDARSKLKSLGARLALAKDGGEEGRVPSLPGQPSAVGAADGAPLAFPAISTSLHAIAGKGGGEVASAPQPAPLFHTVTGTSNPRTSQTITPFSTGDNAGFARELEELGEGAARGGLKGK